MLNVLDAVVVFELPIINRSLAIVDPGTKQMVIPLEVVMPPFVALTLYVTLGNGVPVLPRSINRSGLVALFIKTANISWAAVAPGIKHISIIVVDKVKAGLARCSVNCPSANS
jgi:hypothetical protein